VAGLVVGVTAIHDIDLAMVTAARLQPRYKLR
jgi:hypothetical protein